MSGTLLLILAVLAKFAIFFALGFVLFLICVGVPAWLGREDEPKNGPKDEGGAS